MNDTNQKHTMARLKGIPVFELGRSEKLRSGAVCQYYEYTFENGFIVKVYPLYGDSSVFLYRVFVDPNEDFISLDLGDIDPGLANLSYKNSMIGDEDFIDSVLLRIERLDRC